VPDPADQGALGAFRGLAVGGLQIPSPGLGLGPAQVVGELMKNGVMATVNEQIDFETAQIIGAELGFAEQVDDRGDGLVVILGVDDGIEDLVAALEGGQQGVGDVTPGGGEVEISHGSILGHHPSPAADFRFAEGAAAREC